MHHRHHDPAPAVKGGTKRHGMIGTQAWPAAGVWRLPYPSCSTAIPQQLHVFLHVRPCACLRTCAHLYGHVGQAPRQRHGHQHENRVQLVVVTGELFKRERGKIDEQPGILWSLRPPNPVRSGVCMCCVDALGRTCCASYQTMAAAPTPISTPSIARMISIREYTARPLLIVICEGDSGWMVFCKVPQASVKL